MARIVWGVIGCCCAAAAGCSKPATPPAKTLTSLAAVPAAAAADDEKSAMDGDQGAPAVADAEPQSADRSMPENETNHSPAGAPTELKLEGIRFVVPASWIQVKP
ncbi:MAG TPA: hypothetical protein VL475_14050, partial [Planctomycetaceae bacterium]|nr:hypothetical protein [Planctomycetaceae bacterium]